MRDARCLSAMAGSRTCSPRARWLACCRGGADRRRAAPAVRRRRASQRVHASMCRVARLHLLGQRALLGDLLPVLHAARFADQAASSGHGSHDRLYRHAHAGQVARGVLPAGTDPRRELRARPRERNRARARQAVARPFRGYRDGTQE